MNRGKLLFLIVESLVDNAIYKSKTLNGRLFVGSELGQCKNLSSLYCIVPSKKGYITNWEVQTQILDVAFKKLSSQGSDSSILNDHNLIVTEPYFNFAPNKATLNEIFFEDYRFAGMMRANPAFFTAYKYECEQTDRRMSRYCLIIDTGYSFTHIVPMMDGRIMPEFVLRHLDVRSEMYIMNQCKEDSCYISNDFWGDLETTKKNPKRNHVLREYVLPDYVDVHRGYMRKPGEGVDAPLNPGKFASSAPVASGYVLKLNNERFTVPELLFHPSDVGFDEMGLSEAIGYLVRSRLPPAVRPGIWANCVLVGGNAGFSGLQDRLKADLRSMAPDDLKVNLFQPNCPQSYAWQGARLLANNSTQLAKYLVTRAEYEENGPSICEQRFPVT